MPIFGIRESKKRVIEFLLGLDTLSNEKERERLKIMKSNIERDWEVIVQNMQSLATRNSCIIENLPNQPRVLSDKNLARIGLVTIENNEAEEEIARLKIEYNALKQLKPRVLDNFDALNIELSETEEAILSLEAKVNDFAIKISRETDIISRLTKDLEIVNSDIRNNNDAARLQKFGSEATEDMSVNTCPVCKQDIHDSLLLVDTENVFMNIEDNIRHLKAQKSMLEFSLSSHEQNKIILGEQKDTIYAYARLILKCSPVFKSIFRCALRPYNFCKCPG
jgi:hypothetical protein